MYTSSLQCIKNQIYLEKEEGVTMPRHAASFGAGNFPAASKLLQRYEQDRAYKMHQQKMASMRHRLDTDSPKKHNHLLLRLKQVQKDEERQAQIDYENKLLLTKMTTIMKYGGSLDNYNNYEIRSLNYPHRNKVNEEILKENIGIAKRLETVKPQYQLNKWEKQYQQHAYLKKLWNGSVKDFGEFSPRRLSRMSKARSMDDSLDEDYTEEYESEAATEDRKKLPKLGAKHKGLRATQSETDGPVTRRAGPQAGTKLPKIIPHKHEDGVSGATGKEDTTDVAQLFKIAKQLEAPLEPGRPEDIFIKTLIKKTHKQRMATKTKFRRKYDLDLISELKTGLGLQWELLIKELLEDRGFADALALFDAMCDLEGKKTADVSDVVEVLCTRNNAAMAELKESYRKEFSLTLEEDIMDRTKDSVQTLLLALQKGERDEASEPNLSQCNDDAFALYESGDGRWTSENGLFMRLITQRSPQHMQCVLNEYKNVSGGQELLDIMKEECPKDFFLSVKTYVNCTRSPPAYFADKLHGNKLPSNPVFVTTLVGRSEIDMPAIRKTYKKKYHIDLVEDIKNFSYPTTKCLMELAAKVPPVKKDSQAKKYTKAQPPQQPPQSQPLSQAKKGAPATRATGALPATHKEPQQQKSKEPVKKTGTQQPQPATKSKHDDAVDNQAAKAAAKPKETLKNNGTVKPASNFNAEEDCDKLNRAMSYDDGADETVVVAILPKRSNKQRQEIKKVYEQKYKKNLMIDLESELQGDMEEIVFALLMTPTEYDAYVVHKAVEEMGISEATLIGILCTRSSKELKAIKDYYRQAYKSDMDKDISGDCRGDFGDLVMALCKTDREPGSEVNREQAKNDAQELYKDGALDLKGETFKTLLTKRNHAQVNATFTEYEKLTSQNIYEAVSQVIQEDDDGYIGVAKAVGDPVLFYTEAINSCFTGTGVNDNMLIRTVVPRSEIDLLDIKAKYVELFGKGLWDTVNLEVTASHKNLLLAIINK